VLNCSINRGTSNLTDVNFWYWGFGFGIFGLGFSSVAGSPSGSVSRALGELSLGLVLLLAEQLCKWNEVE
jgi:hypothetical protein